eukprot:TRINITY_DN4513_c0_g2_i1.p1 TRINITY_DN4513_c0_g2~~TRINITY_DN4513_c0_g2_i1.p1  ORF type:complete len:731 (+),score=275.37 TRINITY_DN4513_c0_g2_i1:69-2261(+)
MAEDKRMDVDGCSYTYADFVACYGAAAQERWEASERRADPKDGAEKTRKEFIAAYGGLAQWEEAGRVREAAAKAQAAAEKRVDPADGQRYTKAEFLACYGAAGEGKWGRAAHAHRIDPADGKAYTQQDFVVCYGGTKEWDAARPVEVPAAQWAPQAKQDKHVDPEPEPEPAVPSAASPSPPSVPAPIPRQPSGGASARFDLPKKKEARKVSLAASTASPSPTPSAAAAAPYSRDNSPSHAGTAKVLSLSGASPSQSPKAGRQRDVSGASEAGKAPQHSPKNVLVEKKAPVGIAATPDLPPAEAVEVRDEDGRAGLSVVVVGHVDTGKSTLMGHVLCELGIVPQRVLHKYEKESKAIGKQSFHYAWVLDETEEERERGVTMDIATAYFTTKTKRVTLLDAPGHAQFVSNMVLGAGQADAAVVVVNAISGEFEAGLERGQTREHVIILRGSGIRHLIIAVNKMDSVKYNAERFHEVKAKLTELLQQVGFKPDCVTWVPVSGLNGDNLLKPSPHMPWWTERDGAATLLDAIEALPPPKRLVKHPLRLSVSDVIKNMIGGRIESGSITEGQKVLVQPGGYAATIKSIERNQRGVSAAFAGDNVEMALAGIDPQCLIRGGVVSEAQFPAKLCTKVEAQILCVHDAVNIMKSYKCVVHIQSTTIDATVARMLPSPDTGKAPKVLCEKKVGAVLLAFSQAVPVELVKEFKGLGRVILRSQGVTVGMGTITKVYPEGS